MKLSLVARAKLSFLVVNPTRYCFTFSLPSSTLFCLKSLVTFRKAGLLYLWPLYIRVNSHGVGHFWEWLYIYQHLSCLFEASRQTEFAKLQPQIAPRFKIDVYSRIVKIADILLISFVYLFIFSSINLLYKPFILYYKIGRWRCYLWNKYQVTRINGEGRI